MPLAPAVYIRSQADLAHLVDTLMHEPLLAIDTESNSLYAYHERVCLIQLSTRSQDYIVDPLALDNLDALMPIMASPDIEKVFHAAEYDVMCMKRDFGFAFCNIFDTMLAARICGLKTVGLGAILEEYAGIKMDKSHQRDDWGRRPLSPESLLYAQMDTHFLPYLRDELYTFLQKLGHFQEAQEIFDELCALPVAAHRQFEPSDFWHLGLPNMLKKPEMLILRELYQLREEIAQEEDLPPFKVMTNNVLVALARATPTTLGDIGRVSGISADQGQRYGVRILRAVERGKSARRLPPPPRNHPPDPRVTERYTMLHSWRKERALQRGVDSDVIISKQTLWDLAHKNPSTLDELRGIQGMGPWRSAAYGEEILKVLHDFRQMEGN